MKNIYIMHQYYEKSHFKAIYAAGQHNGYTVKRYIILNRRAFVKQVVKSIVKEKNIKEALSIIKDRFLGIYELRTIKEKQNLIVGVAPYDQLLFKYSNIIKKHHSIYFTSSTIWKTPNEFERGKIENKNSFIQILKENFNSLACVSFETQKQIGELFIKTQVVGHSIEVNKYKKKIKKNDVTKFLYLGQINTRKNIPLVIEWIKNDSNIFQFDFIGPLIKNESDVSKKLLELERQDKRIKYLGRYSKSRIMSELSNYDFLVLPSLEEKFGIVLIEALSAGVPCIISNTFGPTEIIENEKNGIIFDLKITEDFKKKMLQALEMDYETYKKMMFFAKERSNDFDVNVAFKKWMKLFI